MSKRMFDLYLEIDIAGRVHRSSASAWAEDVAEAIEVTRLASESAAYPWSAVKIVAVMPQVIADRVDRLSEAQRALIWSWALCDCGRSIAPTTRETLATKCEFCAQLEETI